METGLDIKRKFVDGRIPFAIVVRFEQSVDLVLQRQPIASFHSSNRSRIVMLLLRRRVGDIVAPDYRFEESAQLVIVMLQ